MSGFLFLLVVDWVHEENNSRQAKRDTMNLHDSVGGPDFADDITLLLSKFSDLREKTATLTNEVARVGLKLNARNCKALRSEQK